MLVELTGQNEEILRGQSSPVGAKIEKILANRKKSEIEIADLRNRALQKVQENEQKIDTLRKNSERTVASARIKESSARIKEIRDSRSAANLVQRGTITGTASSASTIKSMNKTGFAAFSANANEIARLTAEEQNLSKIRSQATEKLKSQLSIEKRQAKTESFGANFRRFRRGRNAKDRAVRGRVASNALIGGAFPLLFGQGAGAAAGGALGGAAGGLLGGQFGFALSLVGTNLGSLLDKLVTGASELGKALGPFTQNTESVVTSLGLQNSVQQAQIQLIEQVEGKTAAFNAAMKLMANDIGQRGVNALKQFGESSRILGSQFTLLITKLQALAAGVANFVLKITGLQDKLKNANAGRVVDAAALRGNTEALDLQRRQAAITAMDSRGGEGIRKSNLQKELDFERQLFAAKQEGVTQAKLLSEESTNLLTKLQQEVDLRNRVEELMKEGNSKTLAEKLAKK